MSKSVGPPLNFLRCQNVGSGRGLVAPAQFEIGQRFLSKRLEHSPFGDVLSIDQFTMRKTPYYGYASKTFSASI